MKPPRDKAGRRPRGSVKLAVIAAHASGLSACQLHEQTGISQATIYNVASRLGLTLRPTAWGDWRHLPK